MGYKPEETDVVRETSAERLILREPVEDESPRSAAQSVTESITGSPEGESIGSPGDLRQRTDVGELYLKATGIRTAVGWQRMATVAQICEADLIVESLADLPAPIGGIITLPDNTLIRACGAIDLEGNRLNLGVNSVLVGANAAIDGFFTDNPASLVIATGVDFTCPGLFFQNDTGPIVDFDGQDVASVMVFATTFQSSLAFGTILDAVMVSLGSIILTGLADGIVMDGTIPNTSIANTFMLNASGTFTGITIPATATIGNLEILDTTMQLAPGMTGLSFAVGGTYTRVTVLGSFFTGGTALAGVTKGDPRFRFLINVGILDSIVAGQMAFSGNLSGVETVISVTGTFVRPGTGNAGTHPVFVASPPNERFSIIGATAPTQQLRYNGLANVQLCVRVTLSVQNQGAGAEGFSARLRQNGVLIPNAVLDGQTGGPAASAGNIGVEALVTAEPGDVFDYEIANLTSTDDLTISSSSLSCGGA